MNKAVLVIEDDPDIREDLREIFASEGFPVFAAANGQEALDRLETLDEIPGLIFLDLMMPVMDGQGFLTCLQKRDRYRRFSDIPVVILSAALTDVYGKTVDKLTKPASVDQLLGFAHRFCHFR